MRRFAIVVCAYIFSSVGLIILFVLFLEGIRKAHPSPMEHAVMAMWIGAWVVHLIMCVAWVRGKRLGKMFSLMAGGLGGASVLIWPAQAYFMQKDIFASVPGLSISVAFSLLKTQIIYVFPCILLALWLLRYHWKSEPVVECIPSADGEIE